MLGAVVEVYPNKWPEGVEPNGAIAFVDRDGVLNIGSPNYINNPEELILLDGAAETIGELKRLGFQICIVTNQSAIFRELWDEDRLHEIHSELSRIMLSIDPDAFIDLIVTCPHRHFDRCSCRKPMPGMLYLGDQILRSNLVLPLKLNKNVPIPKGATNINWWKDKPKPVNALDIMVGDRKSDLGAGWGFGTRLFKVRADIGIVEVKDRLLNPLDSGDVFQPVR
jgi:histidinol-phosphate phosphatase family protein